MRPDELAAHNREIGADNERRVLRVLVDAGDAGVAAGRELAELAGLRERTTREVVGRLVTRSLARRDGKRRVWATVAGRSEAAAGVSGVSAPAVAAAIGSFPSETLRAFVRLMLGAVIARWHLAGEYDSGWPGFIAFGPTKTGKTSVARLVCRILGLVQLQAIRSAYRETPGSLIGRRERDGASATGWRVERSPTMTLPFVCVDEWARGSRELQAAAGGLLLGATADELEGTRFELRPTTYITLNSGPAGLRDLDPAHVRRSVVIDTAPLVPLLDDLDWGVRRIESGQVPVPRLHLDQLRPPAPALPDDLYELLRTELRERLNDDGWAHSDVEPLARIALGRAAFADGPLEQAVLEAAYDYLVCADTLGHAVAGYAGRLAPRLGDGMLVPDPDAAQLQRQQLIERRLVREVERAVSRGRFVEQRARLAQMLVEAIAQLDLRRLRDCSLSQRVDAYGIAAHLREVCAEVTSARSQETLEAADSWAQDPLRRAGELVRQIDQERDTRRQVAARTAPLQRSRRPELAPARGIAGFIHALLPAAHGPELAALNHRAHQLELSPPISEAQRLKQIRALQAKELHNSQMVNPYG
jgi:hypothetical protein